MRERLVWTLDAFDALDAPTLERLLRARQAVFVVEQQCVYADVDGRDPACWHLAAWAEDAAPRRPGRVGPAAQPPRVSPQPPRVSPQPPGVSPQPPGVSPQPPGALPPPLAAARLLPPGLGFDSPAIGRVLTLGAGRASGLGHVLLARAVQACERLWPERGQALSAQQHLVGWYARFGFRPVGEAYDEDGIPHQDMQRSAGALEPALAAGLPGEWPAVPGGAAAGRNG